MFWVKNISKGVILLAFLVSSCRKSDRDYDSTIKASTDDEYAHNLTSDILRLMDDAAKVEFGITGQYYTGLLSCAGITSDLSGNPATMSINFGASGCTGPDGRTRSGQLDFSFTDMYMDSGNVITITPVNYYIAGYQLEGTITLKNKGQTGGDNYTWNINTSDLRITYPDGEEYLTWNATLSREIIAGGATDDVSDDVYEITGQTDGRSHSGNTFSAEITDPVVFDMGCTHIGEGFISLTPSNLSERVVDFGDGNCDTSVVVTISGIEYTIGLK